MARKLRKNTKSLLCQTVDFIDCYLVLYLVTTLEWRLYISSITLLLTSLNNGTILIHSNILFVAIIKLNIEESL